MRASITAGTGATLRDAGAADAAAIAAIYNHYVATTVISMESDPVGIDEMARRIAEVQGAALPWLVLVEDGAVLGYAYASKWRARPNPASVALHERLGFRQVGCFTEVGHKFGDWVDVGYWQLQLPPPA